MRQASNDPPMHFNPGTVARCVRSLA